MHCIIHCSNNIIINLILKILPTNEKVTLLFDPLPARPFFIGCMTNKELHWSGLTYLSSSPFEENFLTVSYFK